MPLDTNIALSVQPLKLDNPMNAMIGLSQLEHAKNQNALAQYQISSAQRADQSQNALNNAYRGSIDTSTGKIDYPKLYANLASGNAAQHIPTVIAQQNLARKNDTEEASHRAKLIVDKTAAYRDIVGSIKSKDDAIKWLQMQINDPDMAGSPVTKLSLADMSNKIPDDPAQLSNWKNQMGLGMTKFITENKPTLTSQNLGGTARVLTTPGLGGTSSVVFGSESAVSMTPGDVARLAQSKEQFALTQGLAREKFTWEKSNPGYELKENDKGEIVGVNKKTLQSFPVTIGNPQQNTAPSTASPMAPGAAASVAGALGARVAATAAPIGENVPGSPLLGKKAESSSEYKKQALGIQNTNSALNKMENVLKDFSTLDMVNPSKRASLGAAHATALLFAKELFNLGVLNGGDERIINSVINNPIDIASAVVPIKAVREQVKDLKYVIEYANKNLAVVHKQPELKLSNSGGANLVNDIHSQADAILKGK